MLLEWIQTVTVDQLPAAPFRINHYTTVNDAGGWLAQIQEEARYDSKFWRIRTGVLQREIQWIRDYIGETDKW